ncbi:Cobalamin biosynthesis bifunctional protein CbiET [bioreactor metagenome]|uniref:Cobalamin biosynthesis bifunctional protein CbiET n=1 Tax=bioreactor metagenome TaxID=1076179 RepID=A0A645BNC2_9ZZZZ
MEHKITVVGIGPGSPDYMLPVAQRIITKARVLVGSKRALDTYSNVNTVSKIIDKDIDGVLDFIKKQLISNDVVVMVSGDPGFYSMLGALREKFSSEQLLVIPGISSAQLAFARLGELWQDAILTSLHGRDQDADTLKYVPRKKLGILTDGINNPQTIAQKLIALDWPDKTRVWLCENLSYENETIMSTNLKDTININGFSHCVMVVTG